MYHDMTVTIPHYRRIGELLPSHWQQSEVIANGIRQHVLRTGGDKPPLLMLHGFMESGVSWLRLARLLAECFDVVMPDARVHRRSEGVANGFSPEILTDDALSLVEELKLEHPVVLGHSNGAVTAYLMTIRQPDLIRALVMEEPPAGGLPMPAVRQEVLKGNNWYDEWMGWMRRLKTMPHDERIQSAAARWLHGMPIPLDEPLWDEDDFVGRIESLTPFDISIFDTNIDFWSLHNYLDQATRITCPMMLLNGEPLLGSLVTDDVVLTLMERIPQLQWQQIEGGGHILSRGRPFEGTFAIIDAFLDSVVYRAN
jgi:pimeloyl-ACP methyl ester carboxylesterase